MPSKIRMLLCEAAKAPGTHAVLSVQQEMVGQLTHKRRSVVEACETLAGGSRFIRTSFIRILSVFLPHI